MAQTILLLVVTSWSQSGDLGEPGVQMLCLAALGLPVLLLRWRESRELPLAGFLPAAALALYFAAALANPSHVPAGAAGWKPNPDWVPWLPTTIDPARSLREGATWLGALVQGGLLVGVLRQQRAARLIWAGAAINGMAHAAVGAAFHFARAELVLGVIVPAEQTYFFSAFFYKNHWAAFGALSAALAGAIALRATARSLAGSRRARGTALLFGAMTVLIAITLPLPGSRAGLLFETLILTGMLLAAGWMAYRAPAANPGRRLRPWTIPAVTALALTGFGLTAYSDRAALDLARTRVQVVRGLAGQTADVRLPMARDTLRMAWQRPVFGWGPGSFELVFPLYQGAYLRDAAGRPTARPEYAHNDWLQLLAELGLAGGLPLCGLIALAAFRAWRRSGTWARWAVGAWAVVSLYALIDFPLRNPAVLGLWTILLTTAPRWAPPTRQDAA